MQNFSISQYYNYELFYFYKHLLFLLYFLLFLSSPIYFLSFHLFSFSFSFHNFLDIFPLFYLNYYFIILLFFPFYSYQIL